MIEECNECVDKAGGVVLAYFNGNNTTEFITARVTALHEHIVKHGWSS